MDVVYASTASCLPQAVVDGEKKRNHRHHACIDDVEVPGCDESGWKPPGQQSLSVELNHNDPGCDRLEWTTMVPALPTPFLVTWSPRALGSVWPFLKQR